MEKLAAKSGNIRRECSSRCLVDEGKRGPVRPPGDPTVYLPDDYQTLSSQPLSTCVGTPSLNTNCTRNDITWWTNCSSGLWSLWLVLYWFTEYYMVRCMMRSLLYPFLKWYIRICAQNCNPLSPHDALKHHFTFLKTAIIFLQLRVLEWIFPWNWFTNTWQFSLIIKQHQIIFIHYKSRIATAIRGL